MTAAIRRVPRAQRRTQLLDVTLALLANEGFDALSMEAVARRAGVSRLVVYRSFPNLNALLLALLRREQARTERSLDALLAAPAAGARPRDVLLGALAGFLTAVTDDPLTWRLALAPPESAPGWLRTVVDRRRAGVERRLRPLAEWARTHVDLPPGALDEELLSRALLTLAEEHGRLLLEPGGAFGRERLLASAARVLDAVPWRL